MHSDCQQLLSRQNGPKNNSREILGQVHELMVKLRLIYQRMASDHEAASPHSRLILPPYLPNQS